MKATENADASASQSAPSDAAARAVAEAASGAVVARPQRRTRLSSRLQNMSATPVAVDAAGATDLAAAEGKNTNSKPLRITPSTTGFSSSLQSSPTDSAAADAAAAPDQTAIDVETLTVILFYENLTVVFAQSGNVGCMKIATCVLHALIHIKVVSKRRPA